jgi:hypothetical protein
LCGGITRGFLGNMYPVLYDWLSKSTTAVAKPTTVLKNQAHLISYYPYFSEFLDDQYDMNYCV